MGGTNFWGSRDDDVSNLFFVERSGFNNVL